MRKELLRELSHIKRAHISFLLSHLARDAVEGATMQLVSNV